MLTNVGVLAIRVFRSVTFGPFEAWKGEKRKEMRHYPAGHPASVRQASQCELTVGCVPLSIRMRGLHRGPDLGDQ